MLLCLSPRERQSSGANDKNLPRRGQRHTHSLGVPGSSRTCSYAKARQNSGRDPPSPRFPWQEEGDPPAPDPGNPRAHEATLGLGRRRELATVLSDVRPLLLWLFPSGRAPFAHRGTEQGSDAVGGRHV